MLASLPLPWGRHRPPWGGADLRTFIHDLVHRDHDKDYRSLAAFPSKAAEHLACHILRVSHRGVYLGESLYGWDFDESSSPHV